jgi:hypothetical protein
MIDLVEGIGIGLFIVFALPTLVICLYKWVMLLAKWAEMDL